MYVSLPSLSRSASLFGPSTLHLSLSLFFSFSVRAAYCSTHMSPGLPESFWNRVSRPSTQVLPFSGISRSIQKKVSPVQKVESSRLASSEVQKSRILCSERCSISVEVILMMSKYLTGIGQFSSVGTKRVFLGVLWTMRHDVSVKYHLSGSYCWVGISAGGASTTCGGGAARDSSWSLCLSASFSCCRLALLAACLACCEWYLEHVLSGCLRSPSASGNLNWSEESLIAVTSSALNRLTWISEKFWAFSISSQSAMRRSPDHRIPACVL